jgi:hypothetical protein
MGGLSGANQNYAEAQDSLGLIFEQGHGVKQDFTEAAALYRKAAERGYGGAQNNLAIACALGRGTAKEPVKACIWFELAATHGDKNGAGIRDTLVKTMTPQQIAEAEKRVHAFTPKD